jgi:hypothetical protein
MRVLDIPAIDMTSGHDRKAPAATVAVTQAAEAKSRRRKARMAPVSKRDRPVRSRPASADRPPSRVEKPSKRTRDGSVGWETFQAVEALVKKGRSKKAAFEQVAADSGKNVGAVSASYYRIVRAGGAVKPRKRTAKAVPAPGARRAVAERRARPAGKASVQQTLGQLAATVAALAEAVKAQDAEVRELRGRLDGVRVG